MTEPLLSRFVRTIARPVGKSEQKRARLHLLDWLACIAGARGSEAHALGSAISTRGWERATYSGNSLGVEDFHASAALRPGPVIWPAALSMPSADMSMRLDAAVRGYETVIAIGAALDAYHADHWDSTASVGVLGACTAFGSLIGFAPIEYANALGNAGSVAGGLRHFQHDDVLTAQWHVFHAVRTGRDAALHVHYGATGPQAVIEGAQGVFAAMTREPGELASNGVGWLIGNVGFKPWESLRDGETIDGEDSVIEKMYKLARHGGLNEAAAERAVKLALESDDVEALDTMLEEWTR